MSLLENGNTTHHPERRGRLLTNIAWLAAGVGLATLLFANPFHFQWLDSLRHGVLGDHRVSTAATPEEAGQLWTCGMHPHIIEDEPGLCPICGMNLVPVRGNGPPSGEREVLFYRNPMTPTVTSWSN